MAEITLDTRSPKHLITGILFIMGAVGGGLMPVGQRLRISPSHRRASANRSNSRTRRSEFNQLSCCANPSGRLGLTLKPSRILSCFFFKVLRSDNLSAMCREQLSAKVDND